MKLARLRPVVPAVAFGGVVLAAAACYGPTQVVLDLSTDLGCAATIRTAVYKPGSSPKEPETETTTCTPGAGVSEIGTLTILPSGSNDGEASIKAVLAIAGKDPTTCDADPTNCIVATRSFSFVAHSSRRVPILLAQECLGTKCPDGQTCGAGGACIANAVTCGGGDCSLPGESDGGVHDAGHSPSEAGSPPDSGVPTPGTACGAPGGKPLVTTPGPITTTLGTNAISWASIGPGATSGVDVKAIPKTGGSPTTVASVNGAVKVLGNHGDKLLVSWVGSLAPVPFVWIVTPDGSQTHVEARPPAAAVAFARTGSGSGEILAATASGIVSIPLSGGNPSGTFSSQSVHTMVNAGASATGPGDLFAVGTTGGIFCWPGSVAASPVAILGAAAPSTLLRSNGLEAFASISDATDKAVIGFYTSSGPDSLGAPRTDLPPFTAFAADDTFIFGTFPDKIGSQLVRYEQVVGGKPTILDPNPRNDTITHVMVDTDCVYYWTDDGKGTASLYSLPKK
jgi:hypothetical protein